MMLTVSPRALQLPLGSINDRGQERARADRRASTAHAEPWLINHVNQPASGASRIFFNPPNSPLYGFATPFAGLATVFEFDI